jgi:hypothetical protein
MGILTKIRQRPDNQKKIFSLVTAGVLTVIIIVVWLSFNKTSINTKVEDPDKLSSISPVQVIKEEFSKALSGFKESTEEISSTTATTTVATHSTSSGQATTTN